MVEAHENSNTITQNTLQKIIKLMYYANINNNNNSGHVPSADINISLRCGTDLFIAITYSNYFGGRDHSPHVEGRILRGCDLENGPKTCSICSVDCS